MPVLPRVDCAFQLTVFLHVRHDEDFRMSREIELADHVCFERTEMSAESDVLLRLHRSISEEENPVFPERAVERVHLIALERSRDVETDHFGTACARQRAYFERRHRGTLF